MARSIITQKDHTKSKRAHSSPSMKGRTATTSILSVALLIVASHATAASLARGWLRKDAPLRRMFSAEYDNGRSSPRSQYNNVTLPGARLVSNIVAKQTTSMPEPTGLNTLFWTWGQFIDHDMVMVPENEEELFNIPVPNDNSRFSTLVNKIRFKRSMSVRGPSRRRDQLNTLSPNIDGSQIYGSKKSDATQLRAEGGSSCFLETSDGDYMKWDRKGKTFSSGDSRVAEQPTLTALHVVFLREHNRLARLLETKLANADNETIYQTARLLVGAEIQTITRKEFLPRLIGPADADYRFSESARRGVFTEFSTACFRFGHTMVPSDLQVGTSRYCNKKSKRMSLRQSFFNPIIFQDRGVDAILRGTVIQHSESLDTQIVTDLRDFLFESEPGRAFGVDLASFNIQRGRDHGLPNYCRVQKKLGFKHRNLLYSDVTSDEDLADALRLAYGDNPCAMDLWVAALAEDKETDSLVGRTCKIIIARQFSDTFKSDRFDVANMNWKEYGLERNPKLGEGLNLRDITLSKVIQANTKVGASFPSDAFMVKKTPAGC